MKKVLLFVIFILIFIPGCAKSSPQLTKTPKPKPSATIPKEYSNTVSAYFPLKADLTYIYKGNGNEYASKVTTVEYVKGGVMQLNTNNGGTALSEVFVIGQGVIKKVYSKGESYWREDFTNQKDQDEIILQQPLKVGTEWLSKGQKYRITSINTKISVPYGTYNAIKVETEMQGSNFSRYFVKDIGIVKEEFISGNNVITSDLSEILKEPVRIKLELYYPDKEANKLVSIKRNLEFYTNQSMVSKIFKSLQYPSMSVQEVLPSISAKTRLLSYKRDDNALRLNFSKEFITEMNAGSNSESLYIDAIVNTFSKALGVEGVIINIENGNYESGHFSFGKNEVLKVK